MEEKIKIDLEARVDSNGNKYLIGKIKTPITIDCEKGVAFLVFYSETGNEELHIAPLANQKGKIKQPKVYKIVKEENDD